MQVEAGIPLRVYITQRVPYRVGNAVQAKLIEPVWAFDRVVIPAGTTLQGQVVRLLRFIFRRPPKKPKGQKAISANHSQACEYLQQQLRTQLQNQANARSRGFYDFVGGPNKHEWLENYLLSGLPYHPQWYRTRTRFDTLLTEPLNFGTVQVAFGELNCLGTSPPVNATAQMRLLDTVSSAEAHVGDAVQGELSEPLFAQPHELLFPQGTQVHRKSYFDATRAPISPRR